MPERPPIRVKLPAQTTRRRRDSTVTLGARSFAISGPDNDGGDPACAESPHGRIHRSVSRILSTRALSAGAITRRSSFIWDPRCRESRAAYPCWRRDGPPRPPEWSSTAWPCTPWGLPGRPGRPERRWALTPPFHPLPCRGRATTLAGMLSVALAVSRRVDCLPVRKHGALWCSDFPHRLRGATIRPMKLSTWRSPRGPSPWSSFDTIRGRR